MKNYVIVIGRQFGSGGREIGVKLAKQLGIPLYDKEILATIAQEKGISVERLNAMDESLKGNRLLNVGIQASGFRVNEPGALFETDTSSMISRNQAFLWQSELIKKLADEGPCVIIGRCADVILQHHPGLISVFITAPFAVRVARITDKYPNHPRDFYETHSEFVQKTDKSRASYYNFHTDRKWGGVDNYHLCLDSSKLGIDRTVAFLADYVNHAAE